MATTSLPPLDTAQKRRALRLFTYGLYALGTGVDEAANLTTVNWVTQVSFDPPLVAVSVENESHSLQLIQRVGCFALSVFGEGDRELAGALGKRWRLRPGKMAGVAYRAGVTGCPVLAAAVAAVECRVVGTTPAGDSTLVVGEVVAAEIPNEGTPLTMAMAGFRHAG